MCHFDVISTEPCIVEYKATVVISATIVDSTINTVTVIQALLFQHCTSLVTTNSLLICIAISNLCSHGDNVLVIYLNLQNLILLLCNTFKWELRRGIEERSAAWWIDQILKIYKQVLKMIRKGLTVCLSIRVRSGVKRSLNHLGSAVVKCDYYYYSDQ